MLSINSVRFNTSEWTLLEESDERILWKNEMFNRLSLHFFPISPDLPVKLSALTDLRNFYRENVIQVGGGLVSVDVFSVKNIPTVKTILKFPQKPTGMRYLGSLTFPFAQFSYVIKVDCREQGITGTRDTLVSMLMRQKFEANNPNQGWFEDPYDPTRRDPIMRNKSEDEQYDIQFSDHPLSQVRKYINDIQASLEFSEDILRADPFDK